MEKPDTLNIPAYQRKRSLAAKSRKSPSTTTRRKPSKTTSRLRDEAFTDISISRGPTIEDVLLKQNLNPQTSFREMKICGICEGYFEKIDVAIISLTSPIKKGDSIIFEKEGGLFEQAIDSMQINRKDVSLARSGSDIGLKVPMEPKVGTYVYKVIN
jgi:hypothetical protein